MQVAEMNCGRLPKNPVAQTLKQLSGLYIVAATETIVAGDGWLQVATLFM